MNCVNNMHFKKKKFCKTNYKKSKLKNGKNVIAVYRKECRKKNDEVKLPRPAELFFFFAMQCMRNRVGRI